MRQFAAAIPVSGDRPASDGRVPMEIEVFRLREEAATLRRGRDSLQVQLQRISAELGQAIERQSSLEAEKRELADALAEVTAAHQPAPPNPESSQTPPVSGATATPAENPQPSQQQEQTAPPKAAAGEEERKKLEEECTKLREKVMKLQQLLAKAKEQFDAKAKGASDAKAEAARLRGELSSSTTIAEDLRAKLSEEEEALERAQEALRALRREQAQRQEALEARVNGAEAELASVQEEFRAYKLRAQSAIREASAAATTTPQPDPSDFLRLRTENEAFQRRVVEAEAAAKSAVDELAAMKEEAAQKEQKLVSRTRAMEEETQQLETKHKRSVSELEAEYSMKYEELRSALRDHRDRSKRSLDEKDSQLSILQSQLTEARQQLVKSRSEPPSPAPQSTVGAPETPTRQQTANHQPPVTPPTTPLEPISRMTPQSVPVSPTGTLLLHAANVQSMRELELQAMRQRVAVLEHEIGELEHTAQLHEMQERALKEQIRELDRSKSRETVNVEYLKNIVVKYMETEEHDRLIPVIAKLLQLTPEELARINESRKSRRWAGLLAVKPQTS